MQNSCVVTPNFTVWAQPHTPVVASQQSSLAVRNLCVLQATNAASHDNKTSGGLASLLAGYSFSTVAGLRKRKHGQSCSTSQFSSTCQLTFNPGWALAWAHLDYIFKYLLCVRAHLRFFGLELWSPMGACTGQYGMYLYSDSKYSGNCLYNDCTCCSPVICCRPKHAILCPCLYM